MFARLHEMKVGDTAVVTRSDGTSVRFTAYRVERFSKSAFPTEEVYGNTDGPRAAARHLRRRLRPGAPHTTGTTSWCSPGMT